MKRIICFALINSLLYSCSNSTKNEKNLSIKNNIDTPYILKIGGITIFPIDGTYKIWKPKDDYNFFLLKAINGGKTKYADFNGNFNKKLAINNMFDISQFKDYYLTNFTSKTNNRDLDNTGNQQQTYSQRFENDSLFNSAVKDYYEKAVAKKMVKDSFSYNQLLNTAVKFFDLDISGSGDYTIHTCVGINDVSKSVITRHPALEAFVFSSIFRNINNPKYKLSADINSNIYKLDDIGMGIDIHEKLLRSQGALFVLMKQSKDLKQLLLDQYELYKSYLPFVLVEKKNQELTK